MVYHRIACRGASLYHAAVFSMHPAPAADPALPTSATNAETLPDFDGPDCWHHAIKNEISRVDAFGAMRIVPASELHRACRRYGDARVSIGNLVLSFRLKRRDPSGDFLSDTLNLPVVVQQPHPDTNCATRGGAPSCRRMKDFGRHAMMHDFGVRSCQPHAASCFS